jgi:D-xylonolactonase
MSGEGPDGRRAGGTDRIRCLHAGADLVGEGPIWHEGRLFWVDILGQRIHALEPDTRAHQSWPVPERIGFLIPTTTGDFIAGFKRGLGRLDLRTMRITALGSPERHLPGNRFNDAKCDRQGRLWAGTMNESSREATGWLYRYTGRDGFRAMDGPYVVTNGPAISPDGATLYHTDTAQRTIHAFDLSSQGELSNRRPFARLREEDGHPDGMTTDAAGDLWVGKFAGWGIDRYHPDGRLAERIAFPVKNVTSCVFGGERLDRLFATSARVGLDAQALAEQPLAGGLFEIADPGAGGLPGDPFRD